jgi:hypothetical protein
MAISLKGKHKCIERNLESDCPICGEYMFTSTTTVIFMVSDFLILTLSHAVIVSTTSAIKSTYKHHTSAQRALNHLRI